MVNKIGLKDLLQVSTGGISAMLVFFAIRKDPIIINWLAGLIIYVFWLGLLYYGYTLNGKRTKLKNHFILAVVSTFVISTILSVVFGLVDSTIIFTKEVFGSSIMVGALIGTPIALLFDLSNLNSVLSRYKYMAKK